jgi:hypothetical protein
MLMSFGLYRHLHQPVGASSFNFKVHVLLGRSFFSTASAKGEGFAVQSLATQADLLPRISPLEM